LRPRLQEDFLLRVLRLLGLLAPLAVALRLVVFPEIERATGTRLVPELSFWGSTLAALAGAGVACLLASLWIGFRLAALSRTADRIAGGDYGLRLRVHRGVEGRLAGAINSLAEALSEKHSAATTDKLTSVANRSALLAALFNEVERANRYTRPVSVAFIDIDHFKAVNDMYGHEAGDEVLRWVAATLRDNVRRTDTIGRYGGEEFMLILSETDIQEAARVAEKLRMLVQREPIKIDERQAIGITISIGVAGGMGEQVRFETIVRDADAAMYSAKSLGRNQTYVFAEPDERTRVPRAPISPEGRASAEEIGRAAAAAAEDLLHSVLRSRSADDGRRAALIAEIATRLAREFNLPAPEIERVRVASVLHDVGSIAVPGQILEKPAPLTTAEWQSITQHPRVGQLILEQASSIRDSVPIILHHHERFSGHGYPHGLRGQDIPLGARLLAVADAYAAMVNERPYAPKLDHQAALAELRNQAGSQFDPDVVDAFCALYTKRAPTPPVANREPANLLERKAAREQTHKPDEAAS
jgi:diguanylate cyclase (GGDEF)-like protein